MAKLQRSGFHQAFRVFIPRMAQHLVRRADFDRAPVVQDQNAVRDVLHHAQIVGHHDDRHIGFGVADGFEGFKDPDLAATSMALIGSSASNTFGLSTMARAIAARCACPPGQVDGETVGERSRIEAHHFQHFGHTFRDASRGQSG